MPTPTTGSVARCWSSGGTRRAYDAYSSALKTDPANMIARRNLQRLELLRHTHGGEDQAVEDEAATPVIPRTNVFIEEVGKTWVDELVNPDSMDVLAEVSSGEQLSAGSRRPQAHGRARAMASVSAKSRQRRPSG